MKENIKFLLKLALTVCLAVAILAVANKLYTSSASYTGVDTYSDIPEDIEFAAFGPSYAVSCFQYDDFESRGKRCFNFGLSAQTLNHDYALYKTYKDNFDDNANVAIVVSYFSFCYNTEGKSTPRYYSLLDKEYIKGYSFETNFYTKYMPVYGHGDSLVRDLLIGKLSSVSSDKKGDGNTDKADKLAKDSKERIIKTIKENFIPYKDKTKETEDMLIEWIKDLQSRGHKPVLVLTPYYKDYAFGFEQTELDECFTNPLKRVIKETGVSYLNCNSDEYEYFITNPDYFNNCDHVSKKGAEEFMKAMRGLISNIRLRG